MKKQKIPKSIHSMLQKRVEEQMGKIPSKTSSNLTEADLIKLKHEFEVQSIELELQNEELKLSNSAAQGVLEYFNIHQTGYVILSEKGKIIDLSLSIANLSAKVYSDLKNKLFITFVTEDTRPIFNLFLNDLFTKKVKSSCEVTLTAGSNLPKYVFLTGSVDENEKQCIIALFDISRRKQA